MATTGLLILILAAAAYLGYKYPCYGTLTGKTILKESATACKGQ